MIRLKEGVSLRLLVPQMSIATHVVDGVMSIHGFDTVITSGNDSTHASGSLHYAGKALDYRTKHVDPSLKMAIVQDIKARLGAEFDVVFEHPGGEQEHVHVEWQPRV